MIRKKVLHIPKWYPHRGESLHGVFVQRHVEAVQQFCDCAVIYAQVDAEVEGTKIEFEESVENDVFVVRCYYAKRVTGINFIDKLIKTQLYFRALRQAYKRVKVKMGQPDLSHVHVLLRTGFFAHKLWKRFKIPYVISEHWTIYSAEKLQIPSSKKGLMKLVVKNAQAVTAVSRDLANAMNVKQGFTCRRYEVVPNTVDPTVFNYLVNSKEQNPKRFVHVSEFNEGQKNIKGILNAVKTLSRKRSDFVLDIIGYGKDENELIDHAKSLDIYEKNVRFLGRKTGLALAAELQGACAMIMFSRHENQPCVILESLACGTPVISTNVGGIAEMITNEKHGLLIENSEKELCDSMEKVLDGFPFDYLSLNDSIKGKYFPEAVGAKFNSLYNDVLGV